MERSVSWVVRWRALGLWLAGMAFAGCGASSPAGGTTAVDVDAVTEGVRVLVSWDATAALWPATVLERSGDVARVRFDADGSEHWVHVSRIGAVPGEGVLPPPAAPDAGGATHDHVVQDTSPPIDPASVVLYGIREMLSPARAIRCDDGVTVVFPGGEVATVPFTHVVAQPVAVGDAVMAHYQGGAATYAAVVAGTDGELIRLRYDEDASEEVLPLQHIDSVLRDRAAPATTGRVPAFCRELRGENAPWLLVRRGRLAEVGALVACDGAEAQIRSQEGAAQTVALADLRRVYVAPEQRVWAAWSGGGVYAATVVGIDGAEIGLRWDDGSTEQTTVAALARVIVPADFSGEPPTCPE